MPLLSDSMTIRSPRVLFFLGDNACFDLSIIFRPELPLVPDSPFLQSFFPLFKSGSPSTVLSFRSCGGKRVLIQCPPPSFRSSVTRFSSVHRLKEKCCRSPPGLAFRSFPLLFLFRLTPCRNPSRAFSTTGGTSPLAARPRCGHFLWTFTARSLRKKQESVTHRLAHFYSSARFFFFLNPPTRECPSGVPFLNAAVSRRRFAALMSLIGV